MDFYTQEQLSIQQDQDDYTLLQQLFRHYHALQTQHQAVTQQNEKITKQNDELQQQNHTIKQLNQQLTSEISTLKATIKTQQLESHTNYTIFENQTKNQLLSPSYSQTTILNRTLDKTFNSQRTKRRVIDGFVGELTQELQEGQELLRKERKMQEELRKALHQCHEELASQKVINREQESKINALTLDNDKLFQELEELVNYRRIREEQVEIKLVTNQQKNNKMMLNFEEYQKEMDKMDSIYRQIETQLNTR